MGVEADKLCAIPSQLVCLAAMADIESQMQQFFDENPEIDDKAKDDLRECSDEIKEAVISRGDISTARNKSAALIARIRDARKHTVRGQVSISPEEVAAFLGQHPDLDEEANSAFREAPAYVQKAVIVRGPIQNAKNVNGALIARIRDARKEGGSFDYDHTPMSPEEIDQFLSEHPDVDEGAAESLRSAPGFVQRAVIGRGPIQNAKNVNAALTTRIRDARKGKGKGSADDRYWQEVAEMMVWMKGSKGKGGGGKGKWGPY